jgi:hypothetical protein
MTLFAARLAFAPGKSAAITDEIDHRERRILERRTGETNIMAQDVEKNDRRAVAARRAKSAVARNSTADGAAATKIVSA